MTPDEAFIEAIRDASDDDTPRLIYADWLEEHGDPHGEFIRVQCELARIGRDDPRRTALAAREQELWVRHKAVWAGPYNCYSTLAPTFFVRGFANGGFLAHRVNDYPQYEAYWKRWAPVQRVHLYVEGRESRGSSPMEGERLGRCSLQLGVSGGWLELTKMAGERLGTCSSLAGWVQLRVDSDRSSSSLQPLHPWLGVFASPYLHRLQ
jgi:uncharacterized protein (TIGR02996 family)